MSSRRCLVAALVAATAVLFAASARAQTPRPMTLIDLMEVPRVVDPQLAPDGGRLLYQMSRPDWKAGRRIPHIYRQEIGGGAPLQMTFGDNGEFNARWSPDGRTLLFLTRRGEADTQIYLMPADGGEARVLTHHATSVASPTWAPDGSAIYFIASEPKSAEDKDRDRVRDDVYAFEENYRQRHLWKVVVSTGAEQRLTSGEASVTGYRVSRDGQRIALQRAPSPLAGDADHSEIWTIDADGEHPLALTHNTIEESDAELSPDNSRVLFLADANAQLEPYYASAAFVMPAAGGTPQPLVRDFPYAIERATWGVDGRTVLIVANMGVHTEIFLVDVAAHSARQLTDGAHSIPSPPAPVWSFVPSAGQMVFQFDEPTRFGDVWTLPAGGGAPVRVTGVYDNLARDFRLPRVEKLEWKGADGATIEGLLWLPLDAQPGVPAPLLVQMHGGPQESDKYTFAGNVWDSYVQVLTAKGYAVLKPNYRGSAGYGNAFLRDVVGMYFRNMHLDVLAGVDMLVKRGVADPERLGLMGWSAGGHLTNRLITVTDRFKAASSGAGATNWISMYAQTDKRASRTVWFGGTPWQKGAPIEAYWDNSPLKNVAAARTPTLFIVGENDPRVPMPQSVEMYRALKSNGVATKLYVAPREGHQLFELRHQLFKMNAELEWFEKYVTGRAYVWERAPGDAERDTKKPSLQP